MKTYGRITAYANISEEELLSMSKDEQKQLILKIMPNIITVHEANKGQVRYLWDYYLGMQDIYNKVKKTRKDINNKKVENWAYALVDFKKNWILGNPIQYTMQDSSTSREIELLNKYCKYEDKAAKDQMIYEDVLVTGRGFKFTKKDKIVEDDEAPFSICVVNKDNCEVVYSSKLGNEQLFSIVETEFSETLLNEDKKPYEHRYSEYAVYLRNRVYTVSYKTSTPTIDDGKQIVVNQHLVTEYYTNRDRISLIEIGKDLFDGLNQLESLDFDDMEAFVNAIMVFTNADIDAEGMDAIQEYGAVKIKSTDNRKASVEMLKQRLNAADTQVFYTRLLVALHQILGIPMATDTGSVTSGDTGKAKLTGQGFASSGIRAKGDETMLEMCDRRALKVLLKICRTAENSEIKELKTSDLDIKFNIDKTENLLIKTQGLMNLLGSKVPKEFAIPVIDLFGDSTAVVAAMNKEEEELKKEQEAQMNIGANEQNNNITNAMELDMQGQ